MGRGCPPVARRNTRLDRKVPEPESAVAADMNQAARRPPDRSHRFGSAYWQMCRRPSSPLNQVPGVQTKPLRWA